MRNFTAAHPSLHFETWVRVKLLATNKNTEVRIIDRGPFVKGRIIDLSRAAADEIGLVRPGTAKVRITVIDPPKAYLRGKHFTVQVSSLPDKSRNTKTLPSATAPPTPPAVTPKPGASSSAANPHPSPPSASSNAFWTNSPTPSSSPSTWNKVP
jgi:rare lipoprotein A (peptidoglycan hydrolase)